jgi:hypothetical protein
MFNWTAHSRVSSRRGLGSETVLRFSSFVAKEVIDHENSYDPIDVRFWEMCIAVSLSRLVKYTLYCNYDI